MTVKRYINNIIDNHQSNNSIYFDLDSRDYIQRNIKNGIFAFQIIYSSKSPDPSLPVFGGANGARIRLVLVVTLVKNLNYNKLLFSKGYNGLSDMWSYDGGVRFQWSDTETLVFDPSIIRNIKLNQILN
jgi:hypothetical protein